MGWCRFHNNRSRLKANELKEMKVEGIKVNECSTTSYDQDTEQYPCFLFGRDAHLFPFPGRIRISNNIG
jgi:hypothetical protein